MKILLVNNFDYIKGGSDRVFIETANLLVEKGHTIAIFSASDKLQKPALIDSRITKYATPDILSDSDKSEITKGLSFLKNSIAQGDLKKCIDEFEPDLAHLHIFQSRLSSFVVKTLKKSHVPMVMSVHEYKILCPVYTHLDRNDQICERCKNFSYLPCVFNKCVEGNFAKSTLITLDSYLRDLFTSYVKNIDKFIMVSQFIDDKHTKRYPKYADKFMHLYNFVDSTKFKCDYHRGDYILYFGRLSREKGVMTLLKAAQELPHVSFKIAGTGPIAEELRSYVTSIGLANVEFLGFQSGDALLTLITHSKFTVVPSEWYENNPMNVIESFFMGRPVIGANIGGISELVKDDKTGFLFESNNVNQLVNVLNKAWNMSDENHQSISQQCKRFAHVKFDRQKHYEQLIKLYQELVN